MQSFRISALLSATVALASFASAADAAPRVRPVSDLALLRYAASRFDARAMAFKHVVLGLHRGTRVVADFPCSDVCPQYTRRIIHYDVPVSACSRVHGVVVEEMVPRGIAVTREPFCEPAVLARKPHRG
jgi:hypothetical protein